jgi:MarR family transcriptional regulator, organic hydroperoxide resistance regulator
MAKRKEAIQYAEVGAGNEKAHRTIGTSKNQEIVRKLLWDISAINVHLDDMRRSWAQTLGITGPQWTILTALAALDKGQGVSVKDLVATLHVQQPFVTTQTKMLEKSGFVRRAISTDDGRVVLMSLSDKAHRQIALLSSRQEAMDKFIFADFDDRALKDISDQIASLKDRLEKAALKLSADI